LKRIGLRLLGLLHCSPLWSLQSELTLQQLNHRTYAAAEGAPKERAVKPVPLCLLGMLFCSPAWSLESDQALAPLNHRRWTLANGAPSQIRAAAQTEDGTLWLGGSAGLFRFDGVRFVRYTGPSGHALESNNISALATWPGEGLWIGFQFGGVSVLRDGRVIHYGERDGLPDITVHNILKDRDGSMWVATRSGLAHLRGNRWERIVPDPDNPFSLFGALIDPAGTLWALTADRLLARASGRSDFREMAKLTHVPEDRLRTLGLAPDGRVWLADMGGLTRVDPPTEAHPGSHVFHITDAPTLLIDREGNLWLGGYPTRGGLRRLSTRALTEDLSESKIPRQVESLAAQKPDELTDYPRPLLEDREGNIWVSTSGGLDRFSYSKVVPLDIPSQPRSGDVLIGDTALVSDRSGTLWASVPAPPGGRLLEIRDGKVVAQHPAPPRLTAAYRDVDGSVWFGGPSGLEHVEDRQLITTPLPQQAGNSDVQALVRDSTGALWISVVGKGLYRLQNGEWTLWGALPELPRRHPIVATADLRGNLWFGYTNNRVARVHDSTVQMLDAADGVNVGTVTAIFARAIHIWIGGDLGLARFDGTRFVSVLGASGNPFTLISGIIETETGELWLNGNTGVSHISRGEIERTVRDPTYRPQYEAFDYLDGILGTAVQVRPLPTIAETSDGRLWFSMTEGIVSIAPTRIRRNSLPPPLTIWSVTAGNRTYDVGPSALLLPIYTTNLQIEYTAGSLSIPERVRFRYQLEGLDKTWQDVAGQREAFYANLSPGPYTFHVIAANNDGVWNNVGASLHFTIMPAFYQTRWFYALCALLCLAALVTLHRLRLRQVRAQTHRLVEARLQAQLSERERIARVLHDTLLQSVQGLILRFQAVADRIPKREPARDLMENSLERADQVLAESRDRVKDLRALDGDVAELAQALAAEGEQLALAHPARFRASVEGVRRDLHPIVREEALLIAREALGNAFRHAGAQHIEAEVSFGAAALHIRIRDDGGGISADVLRAGGRPGHFGLLGMRERAEKIRGHLDIWSKPDAGTEIDLRVPADIAYRRSQGGSRRTWSWRDIFHSSAQQH